MVTLRRMILAIGSTLARAHDMESAFAIINSVTFANKHSAIVVALSNGRVPDACDVNVAFDDNLSPQGAVDALQTAADALALLHGIAPGKPVVARSPELIEEARRTAEKFVDYCRSGKWDCDPRVFSFDQTRERCVEELTHAILAASVDDETAMADVGAIGQVPP